MLPLPHSILENQGKNRVLPILPVLPPYGNPAMEFPNGIINFRSMWPSRL
jgi:hypothetical protein